MGERRVELDKEIFTFNGIISGELGEEESYELAQVFYRRGEGFCEMCSGWILVNIECPFDPKNCEYNQLGLCNKGYRRWGSLTGSMVGSNQPVVCGKANNLSSIKQLEVLDGNQIRELLNLRARK